MKNYWFSFSFKGKNNGICIVQEENPENALDKITNLKLKPEYDDIYCVEVEDMSQEAPLEYNILYSPEEMIALGYSITES